MNKKLIALKENIEKTYNEFVSEFEKDFIEMMKNHNVTEVEKEEKYECFKAMFISSYDYKHGGEILVKKVFIQDDKLCIAYRPFDCGLCISFIQDFVKNECYAPKLDTFFVALYDEIEEMLNAKK